MIYDLPLVALLLAAPAPAPRPPALVGHWLVAGSTANLTLCRNGLVAYHASDQERRGRWSVRGSHLVIRFDYARPRRFRYRLAGDQLTVQNLAKGPAHPMKRAGKEWRESDECNLR